MRMCHFWAQNGPFVLNNFFFVQTIIITLIYLLALFIVQNLKKFLQQIQSYGKYHFWAQNGPLAPNKTFLGKLLKSFSSTYYSLSLCKILQADPELWGCTVFGPKMAHFPNEIFFRKPVNEPCFFHSCLSTC